MRVVIPLPPGWRLPDAERQGRPVRVTIFVRDAKVAGATVVALCLAWCAESCSSAVSRPSPSAESVLPATPCPSVATGTVSATNPVGPATPGGREVWARTLPHGTAVGEVLSPDGTKLFVTGNANNKFETVAYSTATGAQLWARAYRPGGFRYASAGAIGVSSGGAQVYVTGSIRRRSVGAARWAIVAYGAGTGRLLWVSHPPGGYFGPLVVSPDGTTVYVAGSERASGHIGVIAYDAATGTMRWLRHYTKVPGYAVSIAVSPDGTTIYISGDVGAGVAHAIGGASDPPSILVLAFQAATGTLKWATRYSAPKRAIRRDIHIGGAFAGPVVVGSGGSILYEAGTESNDSGGKATTTVAFSATTGMCLWLARYKEPGPGGEEAVTPDGRTVIRVGVRSNGDATGYAITSYNAKTGTSRWAKSVPVSANGWVVPSGLVIDSRSDTVFVASSQYPGSYYLTAWSVVSGALLWRASYAGAGTYLPVAIALNSDGTRLFVTGLAGSSAEKGMTTVAYRT